MLASFIETLSRLRVSGPVLAAVSGGRDSIVMASLLKESGIPFSVAHCNFHLRGEESDRDSMFVRQWCGKNSVEFIFREFDTEKYAMENGLSIEMAARDMRYAFFRDTALERGFQAVAVAHNKDDAAETMMLNLTRGTGIKGLCGMREDSAIPLEGEKVRLIRPMLSFSREQITGYATGHGISWVDDSTNGSNAFKRNKLRNEVFPILKEINPSVLDAFQRTASSLSQARDILSEYTESVLPPICEKREDGSFAVKIRPLLETGHPQFLLHCILEEYGVTPSTLDDISSLLLSSLNSPKGTSTVSGKEFKGATATILLSASEIEVFPDGTLKEEKTVYITIDGPGDYGAVSVAEEEIPESGFKIPPEGQTVADAASLPYPFRVRTLKDGDWMRPLGMGGKKKKLSDMLSDMKIPSFRKKRMLVVEKIGEKEKGKVLCIIGSRIDDSIKITGSSRKALRISLKGTI